MRNTLTLSLLLAAASIAYPATYTITDAYGGQNPGEAANNGDVIGMLRQFDIEKIDFTVLGNNVTANIYMNYGQDGPDTSLGGISIGSVPTLNPGDLMISNGANKWVVPLVSHTNTAAGAGGLTAGQLYLVQSFLTAGEVLNNTTAGTYRPSEYVWGNATGAQQRGTGSVNASVFGGQQLLVTLSFTTNDQAFLDAMIDPLTGLHFASATCGNDVIDGAPVPEPMSMALVGLGLAAAGLARRRKPMVQ